MADWSGLAEAATRGQLRPASVEGEPAAVGWVLAGIGGEPAAAGWAPTGSAGNSGGCPDNDEPRAGMPVSTSMAPRGYTVVSPGGPAEDKRCDSTMGASTLVVQSSRNTKSALQGV